MKRKRKTFRVGLISCIVLATLSVVAVWATSGTQEHKPIPRNGWRSGDVLLVRGSSAQSEAVLTAGSRLSAYSHCGIIQLSSTGPVLIHATPRDAYHAEAAVAVDDLQTFLARPDIIAVEVRRHHDPLIARAAAYEAAQMAQLGLAFDAAFDWSCNQRLYCTELVWKAFERSGAADFELHDDDWTRLPWVGRSVMLPGALATGERLTKVETLSFNRLEP